MHVILRFFCNFGAEICLNIIIDAYTKNDN